ncbi:hypothetical protein [Priestia megaterium]|nr:hypothetical protein [Priestia megaterium]
MNEMIFNPSYICSWHPLIRAFSTAYPLFNVEHMHHVSKELESK